MPRVIMNKDNTMVIVFTEIAGFEIEEHGNKFRVMCRLVMDDNPLSLGDFNALLEAQEYLVDLPLVD